jgi:hypothetical protein
MEWDTVIPADLKKLVTKGLNSIGSFLSSSCSSGDKGDLRKY